MTSLSENGFGNNGRRRQTSPQNPQSKPPRTEISDHKLDPVRFRRLSVQAHQRIHGGPAVARVALLSAMVVCKPAHLFLDELEIEYDEQDDYVVIKRRSPPRSCHDQFLKGFDMGTKMKGIYKGFKYTLSQMFVEKDREDEIEIGFPTDVKHVSHIGWDGSAGNNAPSWMNEFRTGPDFASASIGKSGSSLSPWSHQDQAGSDMLNNDLASPQVLGVKKKQKRRKPKTNSSPKSNSPNSTRSSRASKSKTKFVEGDKKPVDIEVA